MEPRIFPIEIVDRVINTYAESPQIFYKWVCEFVLGRQPAADSPASIWQEGLTEREWARTWRYRYLAAAILVKLEPELPTVVGEDISLFAFVTEKLNKRYAEIDKDSSELREVSLLHFDDLAEIFFDRRKWDLQYACLEACNFVADGVPVFSKNSVGGLQLVDEEGPKISFLIECSKLRGFPHLYSPPTWMQTGFFRRKDLIAHDRFKFTNLRHEPEHAEP